MEKLAFGAGSFLMGFEAFFSAGLVGAAACFGAFRSGASSSRCAVGTSAPWEGGISLAG